MATPMPDCPECGHNLSGVVGGTEHGECTSFVAYLPGDPRGMAGYCRHRCVTVPAIRAWLGLPPLADGPDLGT